MPYSPGAPHYRLQDHVNDVTRAGVDLARRAAADWGKSVRQRYPAADPDPARRRQAADVCARKPRQGRLLAACARAAARRGRRHAAEGVGAAAHAWSARSRRTPATRRSMAATSRPMCCTTPTISPPITPSCWKAPTRNRTTRNTGNDPRQRGNRTMKAAVLHAANQPLDDRGGAARQAEAPRGAAAHRLRRAVPQRPAFHRGALSVSRLPVVLGHEAAAVVEAVGDDVTYVKPGDHVITCLSVFCGDCPQCVTGHPNLCENTEVKLLPGVARRLTWKGEVLNQAFNLSAFAEHMLVHEHAMVKIARRHPARPRRAGRLRRDDRRRRGVQRRQGRAGHAPSR